MKVQNVNFAGYTAGAKLRETFDNAVNDHDLKTTSGKTAGVKIREAFEDAKSENTTNPVNRTKSTMNKSPLDNIACELSYIGSQMKALVDLKSGKEPEKRIKGSDRV